MSKDATENRLEEYPDIFVDIFNNLILEGYGTLKEEDLFPMPTRTYTRKVNGEIRSGMSDIRKGFRINGCLQLICALENQTGIDHTMPERLMGYEYSGYEEQIKRITDGNRRRKKYAGSRRIYRNQKLAPIVTGVLYYGEKKWKYPMRLHEMLAFPDGMEEITRKHVADYPMNIIQVAHLTKEERARLTSDFRIVAEYLACKNDKEKWTEFLADTKEIRHVEEILDVIWELSDEGNYKILSDKIKKTGLKRRSWNMCEIARELERIGMEKGMEKGIMSMIRDNLDMGNERTKILEKIVHYFSISTESAQKYYERTMAQ